MVEINNKNKLAASTSRQIQPGVYCPLVTPFIEGNEDVDYEAFKRQVLRMANAKMGILLLGTNGEACHLSATERAKLVAVARTTLDDASFKSVPLIVGTGGSSARETLALTSDAAKAGADGAIVIFPGYYAFAVGKDIGLVKDYFKRILDESPIPVMIYNFPGAASGVDLDSDALIELSEHANCFGVKLTCAGIGKGQRVAAYTQSDEYKSRHPGKNFLLLPGYSDYLLPAMISGHHGCITGTANIFPKLIVSLYDEITKYLANPTVQSLQKVENLQALVSQVDWVIVKSGISGTKYAMNKYIQKGLGGTTRSPLLPANDSIKRLIDTSLEKAFAIESSL